MSKEQKPTTMAGHKRVAKEGGEVAKTANLLTSKELARKQYLQ